MVGPRAVACLLLLSFLAWPSTASTVEDMSGGFVSYQFDGDNHHDAPDRCQDAGPEWKLQINNSTDGMLAPPDDVADVFTLDVPASEVGTRLVLRLVEGPGGVDLDLSALAPQCDGDVFAQHNQPFPFPSPPAAADDEQQVAASPTPDGACGQDWLFLVNGLDGETPLAIHAAWTDGSEATVALTSRENGQIGIYRTGLATAFTLKGAWINVPDAWNGTFKLAHQPCGAADGGAVYGDPAQLFDDRISFTPIRAGPHLVRVTLADPEAPTPPTSITLSCHTCFTEVAQIVEKVSYTLRADQPSS